MIGNKMKTDKRIVVLQAGWVFMGDYHPASGTKPAHLTDASCVRKWGTTAGLGELALKGPTKETVLDPCSVLVLDNPQAVLYTIKCEHA
jgi:hypothetical protein